jgi:Domain of unknown function (DUF4384)
MKVKALFADGSASAVGIELDASPEPKVFLLGQPSREVLLSAERGVSAAYLYLRRRGLVRGPYASFCDLVADDGRAAGLLGESAGLAFALAFAVAALAREHDAARTPSLAATGAVDSGTADAAISRVDGVAAKLAAAVESLPAGGLAFFPSANAADVPADVRAAAAARAVELVPVGTIAEALARLEAATLATRRPTRRRALIAVALVLVLGATLVGIDRMHRVRAIQIARDVRAGEFAGAREPWLVLPWSTAGPSVLDEARRDLTVVVSLRSLIAGARPATESGPLVLGAEDRYRVEVEPSRDCWVYAFQLDSWGDGIVLFPNPAFSLEQNPLHGERRYAFPDGERWLVLDSHPGQETVVVVAAPWPAEDLEALIAKVPEGAARPRVPEVFAALRERAARRKAARLDQGLKGVVHEEIAFAHR